MSLDKCRPHSQSLLGFSRGPIEIFAFQQHCPCFIPLKFEQATLDLVVVGRTSTKGARLLKNQASLQNLVSINRIKIDQI